MNRTIRGIPWAGLALLVVGTGLLLAARPLAGVAVGLVGLVLLAGVLALRRPLASAAVSSAVGVAAGLYLAWRHAAASGQSICTVNAVLDCDRVNSSAWSEVAGVPTALWATAFYAALLAVSLAGLRSARTFPGAGRLVQVGGLAAVAASAFMATRSAELGAWCLFCIVLYAVSVLVLVAGFRAVREGAPRAAEVLLGRGDRSLGLALSVGVALVVAGAMALPGGTGARADVAGDGNDAIAQLYMAPAGPVRLRGDEPVLGDPDAPVTLLEFADFGCPHCAETTPMVKAFVRRHPEVRLVYKHYPLSADCNPNISPNRVTDSCTAARAAVCAHRQGRFWELAALMFKNQNRLAREDILFMADQVGLDREALSRCMEDPAVLEVIRDDVEAASRAGVRGTPTLFARGLQPDGWILVEYNDSTALELLFKHRGRLPPPRPYEPPF